MMEGVFEGRVHPATSLILKADNRGRSLFHRLTQAARISQIRHFHVLLKELVHVDQPQPDASGIH
jgi:hypothetical protein